MKNPFMRFAFLFVSILIGHSIAVAYPEFIAYSYSTCITCHYNGNGNGPLNDYGRSLFANEIASRQFFNPQMTEEEISESNNFMGLKNLPWWLRPGIKLRALYYQNNPGAHEAVSKFIPMQVDANVAIHLDPKQDKVIVASYGINQAAYDRDGKKTNPNYISREHYFRWKYHKNLFLYFGMLDKVYGIRQIDHTSYARKYTQIAQNDQTHGVISHWMYKEWDIATQVFVGNLFQDADLRQQGITSTGEIQVGEGHKVGASALVSQNKYLKLGRLGVHTRLALSKGSALLAETGFIYDEVVGSKDSALGSYTWVQSVLNLKRGYNLYSTIEHYNKEFKSSVEDQYKWSLGALIFPHPGYEARIGLVNGKSFVPDQGKPDSWSLQSQFHVSW